MRVKSSVIVGLWLTVYISLSFILVISVNEYGVSLLRPYILMFILFYNLAKYITSKKVDGLKNYDSIIITLFLIYVLVISYMVTNYMLLMFLIISVLINLLLIKYFDYVLD